MVAYGTHKDLYKYIYVDKSLDIGFLPKDVTQFAGSQWIRTQLHGCQSFCVAEMDSFIFSSPWPHRLCIPN